MCSQLYPFVQRPSLVRSLWGGVKSDVWRQICRCGGNPSSIKAFQTYSPPSWRPICRHRRPAHIAADVAFLKFFCLTTIHTISYQIEGSCWHRACYIRRPYSERCDLSREYRKITATISCKKGARYICYPIVGWWENTNGAREEHDEKAYLSCSK